jgi:hypothetical protein
MYCVNSAREHVAVSMTATGMVALDDWPPCVREQ